MNRKEILGALKADAENKLECIYFDNNERAAFHFGHESLHETITDLVKALEHIGKHRCNDVCDEISPNHFTSECEADCRKALDNFKRRFGIEK